MGVHNHPAADLFAPSRILRMPRIGVTRGLRNNGDRLLTRSPSINFHRDIDILIPNYPTGIGRRTSYWLAPKDTPVTHLHAA